MRLQKEITIDSTGERIEVWSLEYDNDINYQNPINNG